MYFRVAHWDTVKVTHYTGIGTEIRENYAGPVKETKVVVNMPQGLGRYGIEDAGSTDNGSGTGDIPNTKFEWYLKNHLGSTMLVYGTQADANPSHSDIGMPLAAYDYRAFGEMVELTPPPTGKVTENFTGKEHDDEIALDYFGARYLDPMLGLWVSVDPARQFSSPYLYAGNGVNPVNGVDPDGNDFDPNEGGTYVYAVFNQRRSSTNTFRFLRAYNDKERLYRFYDTKGKDGVTKIEPSAKPDPNYEKTYDVFIPFESYKGGINGKENFSVLTEVLIGHELDHPYEFDNAGHNDKESVHTPGEYFKSIKDMSTEPQPDPIYLNDYKAADEMGVYDE